MVYARRWRSSAPAGRGWLVHTAWHAPVLNRWYWSQRPSPAAGRDVLTYNINGEITASI